MPGYPWSVWGLDVITRPLGITGITGVFIGRSIATFNQLMVWYANDNKPTFSPNVSKSHPSLHGGMHSLRV